ncbi:methyltransferase domain-containing protein [Solirubrobacter ginsenosidimutans]|uniref:Methyltransferase domain-containing protein n=1 Tax=Solirubrobacter ginsenosidimutans TaxID=490573 RepID=A0A9X3MXK4_9ACTN|nr:methyltransferase domain-containing protein [Solirubrobacter ginsenosidimutans]MDA0164382.1 methyltransferase domain-containing protein [Solirubrobacter ginsenosidimutans]
MTSKRTYSAAEDRDFKAAQRAVWARGNYHEFARRALWGFGGELVDACGIGPGQRVLDVAAGSGNVAIRAALAGAEVVASDLTPENFEAGRREASAHGVRMEWVEADAEALPFGDSEFDVVTSAFGAVFAPRHQLVADELLRVCRPGGTIGLTVPALPEGKAARVPIGTDLPSMCGPESALPWGEEQHVAELFGERVDALEMTRRRSKLEGFTNETELRDFLKANHPVAVAMYRELLEDPELRDDERELATAMLDDAFLVTVKLWYSRGDGGSGSLGQEAVFIVARKRNATPTQTRFRLRPVARTR